MQDLLAIRFIPGTKVSHDYEGTNVHTFSYRDLWGRGLPAIGIPCKQNRLLIIDVDVLGPTHQNDGREYWANFCRDFGIPPTYTVQSPSGGYHFYFWLPEAVNPETFSPPDEMSPGVDVKWNGWVGAPPTPGYTVYWGDLTQVQIAPPSLMAELSRLCQGAASKTFDVTDPNMKLELHRPYNEHQLHDIRQKIEWLQSNGTLSRPEWRDGLFALAAGIEDPVLLDEMICKFTMNKSYQVGDENEARAIVRKTDRHGSIGPGSIFKILNDVRIREGAPIAETPFTIQEILDRSRVHKVINKDGSLRIETSESNAAALLGAIFDEKTLYHDSRSDLYMYKGKSHSDSDLTNLFLPMLQSPAFGLGLEKFRRSTVAAGLDVLMAARRRDPHAEYLKALVWDGVPRIESFFHRYVGVLDSEYVRLISVNFWAALAARGLKPGEKFDSMVILEGAEGIHKSSLINAIAGKYTYAPSDKKCMYDLDILRQMHQSVITELPELIGLAGMDALTIKAFLAKPADHIRSLFARRAMENERGFLFVGTTNDKKYLSRAMGGRRFWPMEIPPGTVIDISAIKMDRDQLFAEGIQKYRDGHMYWWCPKHLLDPIIQSKLVEEPLIGPINEIITSLGATWATSEVYRRLELGGYITRGMTTFMVARIEEVFIRLDCEKTDGSMWKFKRPIVSDLVHTMAAYSHSLSGYL